MITLVTDSTADIPPALAEELGIAVVPASIGFDEALVLDGTLAAEEFYARMRTAEHPPRPFGAPEHRFREAFEQALGRSEHVLALLMPFDVTATYTTASAAMLAIDYDGRIKIVNPAVASAGMGALIVSLAMALQAGMGRQEALQFIDERGPQCDSLFLPGSADWLARAGRLTLIRQKLGDVDCRDLVVRVRTGITGLAACKTEQEAMEFMVSAVEERAGGDDELVVFIDHAEAPARATALEALARERLPVGRLVVTELGPTIGSQLGPGTVGIGVAPLAKDSSTHA